MKRALKLGAVEGGAAILIFVAMTALALAILPKPHQAFHYMLAGTFATAVCLFIALARLLPRYARLRRSVRRVSVSGTAGGGEVTSRPPGNAAE